MTVHSTRQGRRPASLRKEVSGKKKNESVSGSEKSVSVSGTIRKKTHEGEFTQIKSDVEAAAHLRERSTMGREKRIVALRGSS